MAIPLHNHTYYSLLDGLSSPQAIADRAKELNYESVACTDHDVVAGHIKFFETMKKNDIKPILGIETYQSPITRKENFGALRSKDLGWRQDNFHLILLAMNDTGLRNLWAMNTEAHSTGFYYNGRVDWELLEKYNEGLIATSACMLGMFQQAVMGNPHLPDPGEVLLRYLNIFGDRFYVELSTYPTEEQHKVNLNSTIVAKQFSVPFVYGNDAHYANPDQYDLHEAVMALQMGNKLKDKDRMSHEPALYIMSEEEVRDHLSYLGTTVVDEAIINSEEIAKRCNVSIPERKWRVPMFTPESGYATSWDMLFDKAVEGYDKKIVQYGRESDAYRERFQNEMEVIYDAGLTDYFLIVRDFIKEAKRQEITVGPGRGSVGGSLVAYLLGITQIDPLRYGLIFERFYNVGREKSLPDIDVDFSQAGREIIKDYITKEYGSDYVADLCTIGTLQSKSAINDMGRVLSINMKTTQEISKVLDKGIDAGLQPKWSEIDFKLGEELAPYEKDNPILFEWARELYDMPRTYGIHASGVIVGDEPLAYNYPLKWNARHKKMVTQWDMDVADNLGYMKMDVLGLRTLDTLDEVNNILLDQGKDLIDYEALQYQEFPDEMYELLDRGLTVGIFQVEDGGSARQLAKAIKPRNIEDLAVLVAMNRPGPLRSGDVDTYMAGREGMEVFYPHEILEDVLHETYGVFLYQEQIIHYLTKLGYPLTEADEVRKIVGKKKREEMVKEFPRYMMRTCGIKVDKFCSECYQLRDDSDYCPSCKAASIAHEILTAEPYDGEAGNFMPLNAAWTIWNKIVNFAKYGFNKSHAVAYAILLLWTLYAKWAHTAEFLLAGIRTVKKEQVPRYINEARRMGIEILPPDINYSQSETSLENGHIRVGFENIQNFGKVPSSWLVKHRPFSSLEDLQEKVQEFKTVLPNGQKRVAINKRHIDHLERLGALEDLGISRNGITKDEKIEIEEELLGIALSDDSATILADHQEALDQICVPYDAMEEPGEYTIAGVITNIKLGKTKKGTKFAFVDIEDGIGGTERFAVWNTELDRLSFIWRHRTAGVFNVKKTDRGLSLLEAKILHKK